MDTPLPPSSGSVGGAARPSAPLSSDGEPLVRVLELTPGQRIQATVVEFEAKGAVTLGLMGSRIAAFSKLPLEIGRTYEFTVASVSPRIVLSAAKQVVLPDVATASAQGKLGAPAGLVEVIAAAVKSLTATGGASAARSDGGGHDPVGVRAAFDAFAAGRATADDLRVIHQSLGHEHEARVLRQSLRSAPPTSGEVAELKHSLKALALAFLEKADESSDPLRRSTARELVDGLSRAEHDNARRTEHGSATWLPLPAAPQAGLRDARMFLLHPERDEAGQSRGGPNGPFTVVLLLDLTRLGSMRVDLSVAGRRVDVRFETVESDAANALFRASDRLRERLEQDGLEVGSVRVRQAPGRHLSVADLLAPPLAGTATGLIDVHA
ncbi:MAG: flagellar hook-length control protein FliK [Planctomycetes bacterium]|nr:flagellar hook-length control protein FliK [Planctomycetota bacterium]